MEDPAHLGERQRHRSERAVPTRDLVRERRKNMRASARGSCSTAFSAHEGARERHRERVAANLAQ